MQLSSRILTALAVLILAVAVGGGSRRIIGHGRSGYRNDRRSERRNVLHDELRRVRGRRTVTTETVTQMATSYYVTGRNSISSVGSGLRHLFARPEDSG